MALFPIRLAKHVSIQILTFALGGLVTSATAQTENPTGISLNPRATVVSWADTHLNIVHFVYLEAAQGSFFETEAFAENAQSASAAGIRVGGSFQYFPGEDPKKQAQQFADALGQPDLPPAVELNIPPGPGLADSFRTDLLTHLEEVAALTGCKPLLFVDTAFHDAHLDARFATYDIWQRTEEPAEMQPQNAGRVLFWRFGQVAGLRGFHHLVDLSRFLGSQDELAALGCT